MNMNSTFPKCLDLKSYHQMQFSVKPKTVSSLVSTGCQGHAVEGLHSHFFHSSAAAGAITQVYQACFESPGAKGQHILSQPPGE